VNKSESYRALADVVVVFKPLGYELSPNLRVSNLPVVRLMWV